jgi:hypothetical protein
MIVLVKGGLPITVEDPEAGPMQLLGPAFLARVAGTLQALARIAVLEAHSRPRSADPLLEHTTIFA